MLKQTKSWSLTKKKSVWFKISGKTLLTLIKNFTETLLL